MLAHLKGKLLDVYCDHCRWQGQVVIPHRYRPPECGPMEQSCSYCGKCYLHPLSKIAERDEVEALSHVDDHVFGEPDT